MKMNMDGVELIPGGEIDLGKLPFHQLAQIAGKRFAEMLKKMDGKPIGQYTITENIPGKPIVLTRID